ncbi:zinc ribbon domain-containing protein [Anaerosinus massiliensis]|uniref:zinc ribbon domain-containing protein n=1 Tax=Massilibacillus massiliensis TaxID=1806837 RepID=UPI000DA60EF0|nr:zinc ribbon domain-containing protein [Massilibacillus massiliensis]
MKCTKCNNEISNDSSFCPKCGVKIESQPQASKNKLIKEIRCKKCGITIPATATKCPFCGEKIKLSPGCIPLIIFFLIIGFIFHSCFLDANPNQQATSNKPAQIVTKVQNGSNVSVEQAQRIVDILKQCGITEINEIQHDEALDNFENASEKAYRLTIQSNIKNVMLYIGPAGSVYNIRYADKYLYQNNAVLLSMNDFILTNDEKASLTVTSKDLVKKALKSPKSADFPWPDEWYWAKEPGKITVQSHVDAQNSFGAEIRAEFEIIYDTKSKKVTSFIFEGKKLI